MRNLLIIAALFASPVMAQTAQQSGTQSADSQAANTVNVVAVAGPQGNSDVNYSGHTWTTPSVGGSYFGGTNPCLVGKGGGVAGGPIALSLNIGKNDEGCSRRSDAAGWFALGLSGVAVARMCQDEQNADAFFAATGVACPGTQGDRYKNQDGTNAATAIIPNKLPTR